MASAAIRDQVIADARSLPDLIAKASTLDPQLAQQLTTKSAVASASLWGTVISLIVTWAVTKWGLGWNGDTCALVSGVLSMGVNAIVRRITDPRVTGIFSKGPTP